MAGERPFSSRHPVATAGMVLVVELALVGLLHLVLGWSILAVLVLGLLVLVAVTLLMG